MKYSLRYKGRSGVSSTPYRSTMSFAPNLAREQVAFDGQLKDPIRFREAMSALHEVVVSDLRHVKKDKSNYQAWKRRQASEEHLLRKQLEDEAKVKHAQALTTKDMPKNLERDFRRHHRHYWKIRRKWAWELMRKDPELFRHLVPCDPVITVAPDSVFFEGFAKDESSYGSVYVDRDGFEGAYDAELGTTNVDFSMGLFDQFQTLRTYRPTRLKVDPQGFDVEVAGGSDHREEKIDLPPSWLRGFGQISAATALPQTKVSLRPETVYSLLAHLKRNREKKGPRSIRFQLFPGQPTTLVLDPWGKHIVDRGALVSGDGQREIRIWGRRRLMVLSRLLPFAERFDVYLLGSGMPSIWVAELGGMRFVLALSGWTKNDWTSGAQLDLLAGDFQPDQQTMDKLDVAFKRERVMLMGELETETGFDQKRLRSGLNRMAKQGQLIYDFSSLAYRYRSILPVAMGEAQLGPEPPELLNGRKLFVERKVAIVGRESPVPGKELVKARVGGTQCEALFDADGNFARATCPCVHHRRAGLKAGPCRHLLAMRLQLRGMS